MQAAAEPDLWAISQWLHVAVQPKGRATANRRASRVLRLTERDHSSGEDPPGIVRPEKVD